jgi:uncharacterized membrane-anchored protein
MNMFFRRWVRALFLGPCLAVFPIVLRAQQAPGRSPLSEIEWAVGPVAGKLGTVAQVSVPASCRFTDARGAKKFMELTQNPASGDEQGVLLCTDSARDSSMWFVVFTFDKSGFVKDDEKTSLDAAAILETLKRGTNDGNEERRSRGWPELEVTGWEKAPYYDTASNNLTWATRVRQKGSNEESVNHSVRLLGREGVMNVDLVADHTQFASAVTDFNNILTSYAYTPGHRYAEWRSGDKVAEYGLTALIAGGAGAAAVKLGLFGKLWKLIVVAFLALKKLLIVAAVAVAGFFKRLFSKRKTPALATASGGPTSGSSGEPGSGAT